MAVARREGLEVRAECAHMYLVQRQRVLGRGALRDYGV
jgi:hypothetical protein